MRAGARIVFQGARAGCGLAVAPRDGFALRSADAGTVPWARVRGATAPEGAAGRVAGLPPSCPTKDRPKTGDKRDY